MESVLWNGRLMRLADHTESFGADLRAVVNVEAVHIAELGRTPIDRAPADAAKLEQLRAEKAARERNEREEAEAKANPSSRIRGF
jgi:hypothetical protein